MLQLLHDLSKVPSPGPAPAFSHVHVCSALLTIGDEAPIGRIELSRKLNLGEGASRTIIKHLTQGKLVTIAKDGCVLTRRGLSLYDQLRRKLSRILLLDAGQLSLDKVNACDPSERFESSCKTRYRTERCCGSGGCDRCLHACFPRRRVRYANRGEKLEVEFS